MRTNMEIDPQIQRRLAVLLDQPPRDPEKAAWGRAAFLEQAQKLANSARPVTGMEQGRHRIWMHPLQQIFRKKRKEQSAMFGALGTILLIAALVLGGGGATVAAAQTSLPDQALYPVKTWSEDVRVRMTGGAQTRLELALALSRRRAAEMQTMLRAGKVPPVMVQARMQEEIDLALELAAGQPDQKAVGSLEQIRRQLRDEDRSLADLSPQAGVPAEAVLERTRTMLQDRLRWCDQGIQEPAALRRHIRERGGPHHGDGLPSTPAGTGRPKMTGTPEPASGGANPRATGTPTPGSSYGPGPGDGIGGNSPWTTGTPTPGSSYGPGPGDGNGGNNPWTTGTPTPGSGNGPGPQPGNGGGGGMDPGTGSGGCSNCAGGHDGSGGHEGGGGHH